MAHCVVYSAAANLDGYRSRPRLVAQAAAAAAVD